MQRRERLLAPGVAAGVLERGLRVGIGAESLLLIVAIGHALFELLQFGFQGDQLRCAGKHVVAQRHLLIARRTLVVQGDLRALGEYELTAVDRRLAGDHPQQRRLARAVAARERHTVAALELEGDATQQRLTRNVLAEIGGDDHGHVADGKHKPVGSVATAGA